MFNDFTPQHYTARMRSYRKPLAPWFIRYQHAAKVLTFAALAAAAFVGVPHAG